MKKHRIATLLVVLMFAAPAFAKNKLDWQAIEKLPPGTLVFIQIYGGNECSLQKITGDKIFCTTDYPGSPYKVPHEHADLVFNRADIHTMCDGESDKCTERDHFLCVGEMNLCHAWDSSAGVPSLIAAAGAGGGWRPGYQPNSFAGVKLGLAGLTLDLQYDRLNAQNGFSVEGSGMVPVLRVPPWHKKNDRLFFRLYAEPGFGYRAGDGPFGQYASAKVLMLIGDKWMNDHASPYIEFQRRFPFNSPLDGDNRLTFGLMFAVCESCGLD